MHSKKSLTTMVLVFGLAVLVAGCAGEQKKTLEGLNQPINCATGEGDIRVLTNEKTNAAQQAASGITAIAPAGLVLGVLTGTEGTKIRVATGKYNEMIDQRIADIKATCNVK